jgi:HNH endonuclease
MKPSIELVQKWFEYDPDRGVLLRKLKTKDSLDNEVPLDKRLYFLGKRYPYSHIIWVVHFSKWPDEMIDHKDHDQLNFKLNNLREATQNQNQHNKRMRNKLGKGVAFDKATFRNKPWVARIMLNNESKFLGSFTTSEEAAEAYRQAAIQYHGEFACLE